MMRTRFQHPSKKALQLLSRALNYSRATTVYGNSDLLSAQFGAAQIFVDNPNSARYEDSPKFPRLAAPARQTS
jgi:hypothetical protein